MFQPDFYNVFADSGFEFLFLEKSKYKTSLNFKIVK